MCDLNDLIPADSGWSLQEAWDINDVGQIVGTGFKDGRLRGFVLTPLPERNGLNPCGPSATDSLPVLRLRVTAETTINSGNRYSEDTVVQAEIVFAPSHPRAGQIDRSFQGAIHFSESPETNYYDGQDGATSLPLSVNATNGVATLTLSSVSVSLTGAPPISASITAECETCVSDPTSDEATIHQWVDSDSNGSIDWLESWSNDLLRQMKQTQGEVRAVTRSVARIQSTAQNDPNIPPNACGYFESPTTVLHLKPNCGSDSRGFRRNRDALLSEVILHESRHVWQFSQVLPPRVDIDADRLRNRAAQFATPIDPTGTCRLHLRDATTLRSGVPSGLGVQAETTSTTW